MSDFEIDMSFEDVERIASSSQNNTNLKKKQKSEYEYEIISVLGKLSDGNGAPILAKIRWGNYLRYDLRKWNSDMTKPYKGVAFDEEEIKLLLSIPAISLDEYNTPIAHYEGDKAKATIFLNLVILSKSDKESGWQKEVNIVDWGYGKKVDFRTWKDGYKKCGKGISITIDEFSRMIDLLKQASK